MEASKYSFQYSTLNFVGRTAYIHKVIYRFFPKRQGNELDRGDMTDQYPATGEEPEGFIVNGSPRSALKKKETSWTGGRGKGSPQHKKSAWLPAKPHARAGDRNRWLTEFSNLQITTNTDREVIRKQKCHILPALSGVSMEKAKLGRELETALQQERDGDQTPQYQAGDHMDLDRVHKLCKDVDNMLATPTHMSELKFEILNSVTVEISEKSKLEY
jgi:hypothetical protein